MFVLRCINVFAICVSVVFPPFVIPVPCACAAAGVSCCAGGESFDAEHGVAGTPGCCGNRTPSARSRVNTAARDASTIAVPEVSARPECCAARGADTCTGEGADAFEAGYCDAGGSRPPSVVFGASCDCSPDCECPCCFEPGDQQAVIGPSVSPPQESDDVLSFASVTPFPISLRTSTLQADSLSSWSTHNRRQSLLCVWLK